MQAFTAAILILAANTAFNGFPVLASLLGEDGYLPRQFARRGDRLVFSNGIVILALLAIGLLWAFDANTTRLIQLYIIGVFVSFTLSQAGMVRHWQQLLSTPAGSRDRVAIRRKLAINALGAAVTGLVLCIVLVTKFTHGAWLVVVAMPLLIGLMALIRRHYTTVARSLRPPAGGATLPARIHAVVLVSTLHAPTLRALAFARATRPASLRAVTVRTSAAETDRLSEQWAERDVPVALTVLDSPYRDVSRPVLDHVRMLLQDHPRDVVSVFIPEYVVSRWWEQFLHNQSALRLKARLLFEPGVMVTSVPWQLSGGGDPDAEQTVSALPAVSRPAAGGTCGTLTSCSPAPRHRRPPLPDRGAARPGDGGLEAPSPGRPRPVPGRAARADLGDGRSADVDARGSALLVYLLAVVVVAVVGGALPGLIAAVVGFVLANWFLTPPYNTFRVDEPGAWTDLVVFVLAAALVSVTVEVGARDRAQGRARPPPDAPGGHAQLSRDARRQRRAGPRPGA